MVKITCGAEAPERANQAWTVAATALAAGADVTVFLTGEAVWFAVRDAQPDLGLEHATPVADLAAPLLDLGVVVVCTQCAARRELTQADLLPAPPSPGRRRSSSGSSSPTCRPSSTEPCREPQRLGDLGGGDRARLLAAVGGLADEGGEARVQRRLVAEPVRDAGDLAVEVVGLDVAGAPLQRLPGGAPDVVGHARHGVHGEAGRAGRRLLRVGGDVDLGGVQDRARLGVELLGEPAGAARRSDQRLQGVAEVAEELAVLPRHHVGGERGVEGRRDQVGADRRQQVGLPSRGTEPRCSIPEVGAPRTITSPGSRCTAGIHTHTPTTRAK